jgi:hypothetical protein
MHIFEQLFTAHGIEYAIAVLALFAFILFYFILTSDRK